MKRYMLTGAMVVAAMTLAFTRPGLAQCGGMMHSSGHGEHEEKQQSASQVVVYPIDYCVVSGEKLGEMGDPVKYDYKGRTVMFCCKGCIKKFEAEPAKYIAALDAAIAASAKSGAVETVPASSTDSAGAAPDSVVAKPVAKLEKLDWCIVSGETLGGMGKTVPYEYKDREMTFCCKGCIKEFEKTPATYLARLDSALAGQIKQPVDVEDTKAGQKDGGSHH